MKISAIITLKKDVLDPQGKVIHQALDGMGFNSINEVRQGKYFEIDVDENDPKKAREIVENMCSKLLANLVIENFKIIKKPNLISYFKIKYIFLWIENFCNLLVVFCICLNYFLLF